MKTIKKLQLTEIDASKNIRRACKKLSNQGIDLWKITTELALSNDVANNLKFLEIISQEVSILSLAQSILCVGQIHPIVVRQIDDRYTSIAGQRRCVAVAVLFALHNICKNGTGVDKMNASAIVWCEGLDWNLEDISALESATTVAAQIVDVTDEQAEKIAFEENDESLAISDLDWGYEFKRLLETINPLTGENYNIKEIASKRRKPYQFVRGRSVLPYLPTDWKEKLDENEINITDAIKYAREIKDKLEKKALAELDDYDDEIDELSAITPVEELPISKAYVVEETKPDGTDISHKMPTVDEGEGEDEDEESPTKHEIAGVTTTTEDEGKSWTEAVRKRRTKKPPSSMLTAAEVKLLLAGTSKDNRERIQAFAEVLKMEFSEAEEIANADAEYVDD